MNLNQSTSPPADFPTDPDPATYTPEPWRYTGGDVISGEGESARYICCVGNPNEELDTTDEANGILIAAAPTMLAALISASEEIEALIGEAQWYASGNQAPCLTRKIRAAISKAIGKKS